MVHTLHQVCVTYRHSDSWDGPVPRNDADAFSPMLSELAARQGGKALFYGDSITTGANSSGKIGFDPHIPSWPEQVHAEIVAATGNSGLEYVNTAGAVSRGGFRAHRLREREHDARRRSREKAVP